MAVEYLSQFVQKLSDYVPTAINPIKEELRDFLNSALHHLKLVTRQEFDTQVELLVKTRTKLQQLEERVVILEQLSNQNGHSEP